MAEVAQSRILCIDVGSSSLKLAAYDMPSERLVASSTTAISDSAALTRFLRELESQDLPLAAVGHRIVFGGPDHVEPELVTPALLTQLETLIPYNPLHLKNELAAIHMVAEALPSTPQVLCFDTAFHHRMPDVAKRYALPHEFGKMVQRFGYHGLSYEYITSALGPKGRRIVAHLGNGASLAAIKDGIPVDTTMGFSPLGGLVMGTRPGDLDPGVMLYALNELGFSPAYLGDLLNHRSGLLGLSETSSAMDELQKAAPNDERAAFAIELFVYTARKYIGAMAAVLDGVDELVFTGGIGENSREIRRRICEGLNYLGIRVDSARNEQSASVISGDASAVIVRVVKTNEALPIARHASSLLELPGSLSARRLSGT